METYNGTYMVLLIETATPTEYLPIAHATAHTVSIDRETRETSSKSTGVATGREYGRYAWSVSVDGNLSFLTGVENYAALMAKIINGTKVKVISVLLDWETAAKAPMSDTVAAIVRDATGDDALDLASTDVETTDDNFAHTAVQTTDTPIAYYGSGCLTNVSKTATDGETVTFTAGIDGDLDLVPLTIGAFAP